MSRPRSAIFLWFERVSLGIGMTVAAAVFDRALKRALRRDEPGLAATVPPTADQERDVELSPPTKQVDDEARR